MTNKFTYFWEQVQNVPVNHLQIDPETMISLSQWGMFSDE